MATSQNINGHSFCSTSRVKILPIPTLRIKNLRFSSAVERLESARIVKLGDVTPDLRPDKAKFNPQSFPTGQIVYDFVDSIRDELSYLEDFQIHKRVFVVPGLAGIADGQESPTIEDLEDCQTRMRASYPRALIHRIFVFEALEDFKSPTPNIVCVPVSRSSQLSAMRTIMSDISSTLLSEFSFLSQTVQSLPTLDSPNVLFNPADSAVLRRSIVAGSLEKGHSRTFSQTVHGNQNMSDTFKKKGKGRVMKTCGDLFLLAGRTTDALKEYAEAANLGKQCNDYLWHGAALEGMAVCLVILAYLRVDVAVHCNYTRITDMEVPVIAFYTPVSNDQSSTSKPVPSSQWEPPSIPLVTPQLHDLITQIYETVFYLYERSQTQEKDSVPISCFVESRIRLLSLYCAEYQTGGWTRDAIKAAVFGIQVSNISPKNVPPRVQIADLLARTHQSITSDFDLADRIRYLSVLASNYSQISFHRRRSLLIRQIILNLTPGFIQSRIVGAADRGVHPASNEIVHHSLPKSFNPLLEDMCSVYISDYFPDFGWQSLKASVLKDCIAICEALPDYPGAVDFSMRFLACALNPADQMKFMENIPRLLSVSKGSGKKKYWDDGIIISVTAQLANMANLPTLRRREELVKDKDPFIFNPQRNTFRKDRDLPKILVQNETAEFLVRLRNPFPYEVDIQSILILTEGAEVDMKPGKVVLEPNNTELITLLGKPVKAGTLKIKGCKIRVSGCLESVFQIGAPHDSSCETEKIKIMGLEAKQTRSSILSENSIPKPREIDEPTWLVIPELPVLSVKSLNSPGDSLMLFEGQSHVMNVTLENPSSIPINLVLMKFTDSASPILEAALQSKTLPASEAYEHEFFLHKRPCFQLEPFSQCIPAKTSINVPVNVIAKRGMDQCSVQVEYSSDAGEHVYTRKIEKKFLVTVVPCVEVAGCDVLTNDDEVLLMLDIRSTVVENTKVTITSTVSSTTVSVTIGRLSRVILPVSKIGLTKDEEQRPIASVSRRQFVVSTSGTPAQESEMRRCFWFRHELLKQLQGEWVSGERHGALELRGIRLNPRMCKTLSADNLRIQLDIVDTAKIDTFVPLTVNIYNDRDENLFLFLRIQPMIANQPSPQNLDITKRVGWNGVLQCPFPLLPAGQNTSKTIQMIFLAKGEYGLSASIEILGREEIVMARSRRVLVS